jgi:hypothetical protein
LVWPDRGLNPQSTTLEVSMLTITPQLSFYEYWYQWFKPRSGQTKNYKIGICCFSAKHAALRRKSKDGLAQNQDVSEWCDMSIHGLLFQWASTIKILICILKLKLNLTWLSDNKLQLLLVSDIFSFCEWVTDCCLMPTQQFFSYILYIMTRTS